MQDSVTEDLDKVPQSQVINELNKLGYSSKLKSKRGQALINELSVILQEDQSILVNFKKSGLSRTKIHKVSDFCNLLIEDIFTKKNKFNLIK